ncbi:MAG TPA: Asp23/Gls24 family envelope stress response protein [Candidatus Limnocylindrales bacterium]
MPERPTPGRAVVSRRAVTDIVRTAVLGCYGVAGFATPTPWGHVVRRLGFGEPGIRVVLDDLRVALRIRVAYGLPIAEVARQVESAVRYAIGRDLGREPSQVTIQVDGLEQRDGSVPPATEPLEADAAAEPPTTDAAGADAPESAAAGAPPGAGVGPTADADPGGATDAGTPARDAGVTEPGGRR